MKGVASRLHYACTHNESTIIRSALEEKVIIFEGKCFLIVVAEQVGSERASEFRASYLCSYLVR